VSTSDRADISPVGQACSLLSSWTGLELRGTAPRRVGEFLSVRAEQTGYASKEAYVAFLQTLSPTDDEPQQLINLVTNGLTCFWRDVPQLNALETVFSKLRDSRSANKPVNVWCAGCSTGEEAYTVAMIAAELDVPVHVLGSDLNTESLRHASEGVYGEWSLRRTEDEHRQRYFEPTGDQRFRIIDALRADADEPVVRFEHHNILTEAPRPPSADCWDVIMCRNVLIYFSDEAMRSVLRHFSDRLHKDGYLLLGSSEQLHTANLSEDLVPFRAARQGGGFVYRLRATPPGRTALFPPRDADPDHQTPPPAPSRSRSRSRLSPVDRSSPAGPTAPANPTAPAGQSNSADLLAATTFDLNFQPSLEEETSDITCDVTTHEAANSLLDMALEHLSHERMEPALACCEATASYDPFVPENYCLMAYILTQEGASVQALETYRKALFLDPLNWLAALESARLHMRRGDALRARRSLRQAVEGLKSGKRRSRGMRKIGRAMTRAITEPDAAEAFCAQYLERLRGEKFLD
jgi:chemotaxis protein methyltransferase CheR